MLLLEAVTIPAIVSHASFFFVKILYKMKAGGWRNLGPHTHHIIASGNPSSQFEALKIIYIEIRRSEIVALWEYAISAKWQIWKIR